MDRKTLALAIACLWLAAIPHSATSQGDAKDDPLSGKTFQSLEKMESGLSPKGVVLDHWRITFKAGRFTWHHSDVSESGVYRFEPDSGKITGVPASGKLKYAGTFDVKTGVLTWEKAKYKEANGK